MDILRIAVGASDNGKTSPTLPYIGAKANGAECANLCKFFVEAALLRCGFDVLDCPSFIDPQDMTMRVNRYAADGAVLISYDTFGSGKSFNDFGGGTVRYTKRMSDASRLFAEDICAYLHAVTPCTAVCEQYQPHGTACPFATVSPGMLTDFGDATKALDPDFAVAVGEHIALGVCEYFGMPYVCRDDITAYPLLGKSATGVRGLKIKLLQTLLCANGHELAVDGVYGNETELAVKIFCLNNEYEQSGITPAVWRDLLWLSNVSLKPDSRHNYVLYIQRKLYSKLYPCPRNGSLDSKSIAQAREYLSETTTEKEGLSEKEVKLILSDGGVRPRLF